MGMDQTKKARIAAELKKVMPKTWKYTLGVDNHNTIVLNIMKAPVDLIAMANKLGAERAARQHYEQNVIKDSYQANSQYPQNSFEGETLEIMKKACAALYSADWYDRSDSMRDYFDTAYYVQINVGKWNKPFEHVEA